MSVLIRMTQDGRRVEVIGGAVCLDGAPEAHELVEVARHPNREAILGTAPGATHMAGRVPLTETQAQKTLAALAAAYNPDPLAIEERLRRAVLEKARIDGIE
jgi:hypothetical protein